MRVFIEIGWWSLHSAGEPDRLIPAGECLPERLLIFGSSPVHCHGASLECEALDSRKEFDDSPAEICACWMLAAHDGSIGFHIEVSSEF